MMKLTRTLDSSTMIAMKKSPTVILRPSLLKELPNLNDPEIEKELGDYYHAYLVVRNNKVELFKYFVSQGMNVNFNHDTYISLVEYIALKNSQDIIGYIKSDLVSTLNEENIKLLGLETIVHTKERWVELSGSDSDSDDYF